MSCRCHNAPIPVGSTASSLTPRERIALAAARVPEDTMIDEPHTVVDRLAVSAIMDRRPLPVALAKVAMKTSGQQATPVVVVSLADEARRDITGAADSSPGESVAPALVAVSLDPADAPDLQVPDPVRELPGVVVGDEIEPPPIAPVRSRARTALYLGAAALAAWLLLRRAN